MRGTEYRSKTNAVLLLDFGKNIRDIPQTIYLDYYFYSIHGMATLMLKSLKTSFNNKIITWNVKKSKVKET